MRCGAGLEGTEYRASDDPRSSDGARSSATAFCRALGSARNSDLAKDTIENPFHPAPLSVGEFHATIRNRKSLGSKILARDAELIRNGVPLSCYAVPSIAMEAEIGIQVPTSRSKVCASSPRTGCGCGDPRSWIIASYSSPFPPDFTQQGTSP